MWWRMSYWTILVTRDGEKSINATVESILDQTKPPHLIFIIDDGSTDRTQEILHELKERYSPIIQLAALPDRGYDIRRVVHNLNVAIQVAEELDVEADYMLISGDDCIYPQNYVEYLVDEMERDRDLVVVSGSILEPGRSRRFFAPHGSGRIVRSSFFRQLGNRYPPQYGYETWLLYEALRLGFKVRNFGELSFKHLRRLGSLHAFEDWGLAMRCLGFHPLEVLRRCLSDLDSQHISPRDCFKMLRDYFRPIRRREDPYFKPYSNALRGFVFKHQRRRIPLTSLAVLVVKSLVKLPYLSAREASQRYPRRFFGELDDVPSRSETCRNV